MERNEVKQGSTDNGTYFQLSEDYFTAFARRCKKIEFRKKWTADTGLRVDVNYNLKITQLYDYDENFNNKVNF